MSAPDKYYDYIILQQQYQALYHYYQSLTVSVSDRPVLAGRSRRRLGVADRNMRDGLAHHHAQSTQQTDVGAAMTREIHQLQPASSVDMIRAQ